MILLLSTLLLSTLALAEPHEAGDRPEHAERRHAEHAETNPDIERLRVELQAAEAQMKLLLLDHQAATEAERPALRAQLEGQVGVVYDLKTQAHTVRLEALEAKLASAQDELAQRQEKKDERIERWLDENLDE